MTNHSTFVLLAFLVPTLGACGAADDAIGTQSGAVKVDNGKHLFNHETFDGNGRTCSSCHLKDTGTMSPADVQKLYAHHPNDPLFRSLDSDDGVGNSYTRLLQTATVRLPIPLPANVVLLDDPTARVVYLNRGTPTVMNIGLDPVLMVDGRQPDLTSQAIGAVDTHYQAHREPTSDEASAIAAFQRTLFNRDALEDYANGGPAPTPPAGCTASEKRGRAFFDPTQPRGLCASCHNGSMLNETGPNNPFQPVGQRFSSNFSAEFNHNNFPVHTFQFTLPDNSVITMVTPDAGRALITGNPCTIIPNVCGLLGPGTAGSIFKIPTLWGVKETAPYFHDNSAATLSDVVDHYQQFFAITAQGTGNDLFLLSDQDKADSVAFLQLL